LFQKSVFHLWLKISFAAFALFARRFLLKQFALEIFSIKLPAC
jgi:hypothetical protein